MPMIQTKSQNDSQVNSSVLNDELGKIGYWLLVNKLFLNNLKLNFMLFYQAQKRIISPNIKINIIL